jgi:nucleoid DNA-binding protein
MQVCAAQTGRECGSSASGYSINARRDAARGHCPHRRLTQGHDHAPTTLPNKRVWNEVWNCERSGVSVDGNTHRKEMYIMTTDTPVKKPATAKKTGLAVAAPASTVTKTGAKPAPKPAAKAAPAELAKTAAPLVKVKANTLKIKDVLEQVATSQGGKKKGMKEVVEATLTALGAAFARGDAVNLPGFGRARVAQVEDAAAGKPATIKLKSGTATGQKQGKKQGLADLGD